MLELTEWLDSLLQEPLPEDIAALNFNLYDDGDHCWSAELIGAGSFDADDPDCACDEVFAARDSLLRWEQDGSWEQVLEDVIAQLEAYLESGRFADKLKSYQGIGVGFVDGDVVLMDL
ncbi:MAG: hypothetical protein LUH04_09480 [Clostridium sp.]|nr:hypothetical protein [Clostridium sp.]